MIATVEKAHLVFARYGGGEKMQPEKSRSPKNQ